MADLAQADLAEAMPALEEAVKVVIALLSFFTQVCAQFVCASVNYDNVHDWKLKVEFSVKSERPDDMYGYLSLVPAHAVK